jgi:hypothetical protein
MTFPLGSWLPGSHAQFQARRLRLSQMPGSICRAVRRGFELAATNSAIRQISSARSWKLFDPLREPTPLSNQEPSPHEPEHCRRDAGSQRLLCAHRRLQRAANQVIRCCLRAPMGGSNQHLDLILSFAHRDHLERESARRFEQGCGTPIVRLQRAGAMVDPTHGRLQRRQHGATWRSGRTAMLNVNSSFLANVSGQWPIQQQPSRWFGGVLREPLLPPEVFEPVRRRHVRERFRFNRHV